MIINYEMLHSAIFTCVEYVVGGFFSVLWFAECVPFRPLASGVPLLLCSKICCFTTGFRDSSSLTTSMSVYNNKKKSVRETTGGGGDYYCPKFNMIKLDL